MGDAASSRDRECSGNEIRHDRGEGYVSPRPRKFKYHLRMVPLLIKQRKLCVEDCVPGSGGMGSKRHYANNIRHPVTMAIIDVEEKHNIVEMSVRYISMVSMGLARYSRDSCMFGRLTMRYRDRRDLSPAKLITPPSSTSHPS